jgi:hypothetical protein
VKPDPDSLKRHFDELPDGALLAMDRDGLTPAAQQHYDDQFRRRKLARPIRTETPSQVKPDWFQDSAVVHSWVIFNHNNMWMDRAGEPASAQAALCDAGIPCYLEVVELPPEDQDSGIPEPVRQWQLSVPGKLNIRATSVLEEVLFNPEFEEKWRVHLEQLTNGELKEMSPEVVFAGLFDRIERVTRAYNEELRRRGLK